MNIGLVDVDSVHYPNLPLMKISAYHKSLGDTVGFAIPCENYDRVYVSKIFTESEEPAMLFKTKEILRGGSGYDLQNRLPDEIEHQYPDYSLYPQYTKDTAYGWLTRGCPRLNHAQCNGGFCITPEKDGCVSRKVADLSEFWNGQKNIILYDQNILACKDRFDLLEQLASSKARVEFNGGMDVRYINHDVIEAFRKVKVKDYHFAWDDPREDLENKFVEFKESGLKKTGSVGVYVLTNFWSSFEEDLYRIYTLRKHGYMPYVMIYGKQEFFDANGHWLPDVAERKTEDEMRKAKICQHLQRWTTARALIKSVPDFEDYEYYKKWKNNGMPVPKRKD